MKKGLSDAIIEILKEHFKLGTFAEFLNTNDMKEVKRFQIASVYRDQNSLVVRGYGMGHVIDCNQHFKVKNHHSNVQLEASDRRTYVFVTKDKWIEPPKSS